MKLTKDYYKDYLTSLYKFGKESTEAHSSFQDFYEFNKNLKNREKALLDFNNLYLEEKYFLCLITALNYYGCITTHTCLQEFADYFYHENVYSKIQRKDGSRISPQELSSLKVFFSLLSKYCLDEVIFESGSIEGLIQEIKKYLELELETYRDKNPMLALELKKIIKLFTEHDSHTHLDTNTNMKDLSSISQEELQIQGCIKYFNDNNV